MTYEDAIETIQDMLDVMEATGNCYVYKHNGGDIRLKNVLECLRAKREAEKNEPLSLDELRKMRYGWAWAISDDPDLTVSGWAYVSETGAITIWEYKPDSIVGNVQLEWKDYGKTWLAYSHQPKDVCRKRKEI